MKKNLQTITSVIIVTLFLLISFNVKNSQSTPSTNVKNTLSSSQLSYFARIGTGTSAGDNLIKINTAANPSRTTNNLFEGDTVCIADSGGGCDNFDVTDIGNTAYFQIDTPLPAVNAVVGSYVIATRSAQHVVTFTPQSNITGGKWQVLIKATSKSGEKHNDGIPDQEGFDIGAAVVGNTGPGAILRSTDVSCPWSMTVSGIGDTVGIVAANGTTYYYHTITCSLAAGATNPIGSPATITIGGSSITNATQLTNPAPDHVPGDEGEADLYNFFVRHLDSAGTVIDGDTARGQIAMVEAVRVSATVDPTISFIIDNVGVTNVGTSVCPGATLKATANQVTATQVPFGSLSLQAFNDLAQRLTCTTNASHGYTVTVYEDMPLTMIGGSTTIPNTTCNSGCTSGPGGQASWNSYAGSISKFGYSLNPPVTEAATTAFTTGASFNAKPFGIGSANAATIFSKASTPTGNERTYICYRTTITNTQPAGNYENKLIYTATATF
jgi:hypothetical protein